MKILSIIVIFLICFVCILWYTLSGKVNEVSDKELYAKMLNVPVLSKKEMVLAKNFPPFKIQELNVLSEHNHLDDRAEVIVLLPINTEVKFLKAFEHTGGTSGFTKIVLVGVVTVENKVYKMEYLMHPEIIDFILEKGSKEFTQFNADFFKEYFVKK